MNNKVPNTNAVNIKITQNLSWPLQFADDYLFCWVLEGGSAERKTTRFVCTCIGLYG